MFTYETNGCTVFSLMFPFRNPTSLNEPVNMLTIFYTYLKTTTTKVLLGQHWALTICFPFFTFFMYKTPCTVLSCFIDLTIL